MVMRKEPPPTNDVKDPVLWINGTFTFLGTAAVSPADRGFLYGDGLYETLRADHGNIHHLESHLRRLEDSMTHLNYPGEVPLPDRGTLVKLLTLNNLLHQIARVKIVVTRGPTSDHLTTDGPTVVCMAEPYVPPSHEDYLRGWSLQTGVEGYAPPLARHKSLNYLYFLLVKEKACQNGFDDAILTDPEGHVTETTCGNILYRTGGHWWTPESRWQLPGTMRDAVMKEMGKRGMPVRFQPTRLSILLDAETIWITNSLLGIMPVYRIENRFISENRADLARELRSVTLGVCNPP